jgi:hypothetical protein
VPVYFPSYFSEDFFGSTPGDFSGWILRRLSASGHPFLSAFRPFTPPGGMKEVIIHFRPERVKPKIQPKILFLFLRFTNFFSLLPYHLISLLPVTYSLLSALCSLFYGILNPHIKPI